MDWSAIANYLLSMIPGAKLVSGKQEINCRCFYCGDSIRSAKSAHMYISIPSEGDDKPMFYYCHKCNAKGIVTHQTLISWGIYDKDIALDINERNNYIKNSSSGKRYFTPKLYRLSNTYVTANEKSEEKLNYICNRLGCNLTYDDLKRLKISLNLIDLLEENNISKLSRDLSIVKELDREFIGFISVDNAFLNMRRTCQEGIVNPVIDKRYINYKIFDKFETSERFYVIPSSIDLLSRERIKLHIAEGPFDILSIYLNLRNQEPGIYASVAGNNYINVLSYFLSTVKIPYIEIHMYTDNDKYGTVDRVRYIMNQIPDKTIPVYIHKNTYPGEKDFGVDRNHITESIMKI